MSGDFVQATMISAKLFGCDGECVDLAGRRSRSCPTGWLPLRITRCAVANRRVSGSVLAIRWRRQRRKPRPSAFTRPIDGAALGTTEIAQPIVVGQGWHKEHALFAIAHHPRRYAAMPRLGTDHDAHASMQIQDDV